METRYHITHINEIVAKMITKFEYAWSSNISSYCREFNEHHSRYKGCISKESCR